MERLNVIPAIRTLIGLVVVLCFASAPGALAQPSVPGELSPAPVLEPAAFLAGGRVRDPQWLGEHVIVARGNVIEAWHAESGEARGYLPLPKVVQAIAVQPSRIVASYGNSGLAVLSLSERGELALVALHDVTGLYATTLPRTPAFRLQQGLLLVDDFLYFTRTGGAHDMRNSFAVLAVANLGPEGELGLVGETVLDYGWVRQIARSGDRIYGLLSVSLGFGNSGGVPFLVDVSRRHLPQRLPLVVVDEAGAPLRLDALRGMGIDGDTVLFGHKPRQRGVLDPEPPGEILVFDRSNPGLLRLVSRLEVGPRPVALSRHEHAVYVLAGDGDFDPLRTADPGLLLRIDVARPASPTIVWRKEVGRSPAGLATDGSRLVVTTGGGDLEIERVDGAGAPRRDWVVDGPGAVRKVVASGDVAVVLAEVALEQTEAVVLDTSVLRHPRAVARIADTAEVDGLALRGRWLMLSEPAKGGSDLRLVDLADPRSPRERGRLAWRPRDELGRTISMAWRDDRSMVVASRSWLGIVDLADPDAPRVERMLQHGVPFASLLDVEGDLAVVGPAGGTWLELVALDGRDGKIRHELAGLGEGLRGNVWLRFDLHQGELWVAAGRDLWIFAAETEALGHREIARHDELFERSSGLQALRRQGPYALAAEWDRLRVFEAGGEGSLPERQGYETPDHILDLAVDGARVYIAAGEGGLHVLSLRPEVLPWRVVLPWARAGAGVE
jgi:hypothetical protein